MALSIKIAPKAKETQPKMPKQSLNQSKGSLALEVVEDVLRVTVMTQKNAHSGSSIELVVLGLLAALIVVLAMPLFGGMEIPQSEIEAQQASLASE
jgi:hypothetical protein